MHYLYAINSLMINSFTNKLIPMADPFHSLQRGVKPKQIGARWQKVGTLLFCLLPCKSLSSRNTEAKSSDMVMKQQVDQLVVPSANIFTVIWPVVTSANTLFLTRKYNRPSSFFQQVPISWS